MHVLTADESRIAPAAVMYKTESLQTQATMPMVRIRCMEGVVGKWLPLQQNWSSRSCTLPERYMESAQRIHAFETRDSDVFVVTFMKCGTTWMQELAWLLLNQLDFEAAKSSYVMERSRFLEYSAITPQSYDTITACEEMVSPRLIKSHLPAQLLPQQVWQQGRKIIYVARNPKDVVVSSYHFLNGIKMWKGDLDTFVNEFMKDEILYTSFWSHIVDFWRMRNEPNIFFVTYEEMKRDLRAVVKRLCKFLSVDDVKDNQMEQLLQHLSFDNMKGSKYSNLTGLLRTTQNTTKDFEFMRRGVVGSYNDELSAEHRQKLDKWTSDFLKPYDISESDIFGEL
ncbi:estrogen sulfotransferase-like isoform X1 [Drosophila novamexicana]|uniref:estrogen sulfotransferase-like isoform X1 n=2 Tax=Drosophila novamexicana TaxID=47314 RepID=UPI0011E5CBE3|nr:estrogen sulfotransferase-like isoform X1 [Drosophila novamexicana]XP_030565365.1 estrogen sulfotransferase-like isoform X1 [Drosophila novamexicana]